MVAIAAGLIGMGGLIVFSTVGANAQTTEAAPQAVVVNVSSDCTYFCFAPSAVTVVAGGTVTWVNDSDVPHPIARCTPAACQGHAAGTGLDPAFTAVELAMPASGSAKYTFNQPGTYVYYCTLHGYALMRGTITVTAAPPTTVPITSAPAAVPPTPAPAATTPAGPTLANTGHRTGGLLVVAVLMIVCGLTATAFRRPHRYS